MARKDVFDFWPDAVLPASIFVVGGLVGGYLIYRKFRNYSHQELDYRFNPRFFLQGAIHRWIYAGLVTTYLVSIVSIMALALVLPMSLPYVWWSTEPATGYKDGTVSGEGSARLLSHSGGYWYAISQPVCKDSSGTAYRDKKGEEGRYYSPVMAIPNGDAKDVRVVDP